MSQSYKEPPVGTVLRVTYGNGQTLIWERRPIPGLPADWLMTQDEQSYPWEYVIHPDVVTIERAEWRAF